MKPLALAPLLLVTVIAPTTVAGQADTTTLT
jgi:hypothetical protein